MIYFHSFKLVPLPVMKSGFEPPLYSGLVSSAPPVAAFADFWAGQPVCEVFCFASLCLFACASPASEPVFVQLNGRQSYIYCTDPSCPAVPAPET